MSVKRRTSPKLYLVREDEWGVVEEPLFADWEKGEEAFAARAFWQHAISRKVRVEVEKAPYLGSVSSFVSMTDPPDGTNFEAELNGVDWMPPEHALHLAFHLGRSVLPAYDREALIYPFHLRVDQQEGDAPKS